MRSTCPSAIVGSIDGPWNLTVWATISNSRVTRKAVESTQVIRRSAVAPTTMTCSQCGDLLQLSLTLNGFNSNTTRLHTRSDGFNYPLRACRQRRYHTQPYIAC